MNFNYNEDQQAILDTAERIFKDLCSDEQIRDLTETDALLHQKLWLQLAESGMLGLVIDETYNGSGLGLFELCMLFEVQGKYVAPIPLLSSIVECAMTIGRSDNEVIKRQVLPQIVSGECILAPVKAYTGLISDKQPLQLKNNQLNGCSGFSPYLPCANAYVATVIDAQNEQNIIYIDANSEGISIVSQTTISDESGGYLQCDAVDISPEQILASGDKAQLLATAQLYRAWIALAAIQTGVLSEGLQRAAIYVSQRKQFGRPLGTFQAVSQQAADAYMDVEALRSVYYRALEDVENDNDISLSAAVAKYWVSEAGHSVGHKFLHLHGGIGQDLSYPIHRYFLWAKHCERYLGSASQIMPNLGRHIVNNIQQLS